MPHSSLIKRRFIVVCLMLLAGCVGLPPSHEQSDPPSKQTPMPPPSSPLGREKTIGRQFIQSALKEFTFVKDFEVIAQVNRVGDDILEAIGEDPSDFHFFVIRQNQLNAFAVPGGYIFIFDGLLRNLKTTNALAGVLAHEIAHVQKRHFFKDAKKINAINLATMASIILAGMTGNSPGATSAIASAANISFQLKFSRANEEEADLYAIKYLKQTRYNPGGLSEFFKTLSFYAGFTRGVAPTYFSTHPGLTERTIMAEALTRDFVAEQKAPPAQNPNWRQDWGRVLTILQAQGTGDTGQDEKEDSPLDEARQLYLKGLSLFRSGRLNAAVVEYQDAIRQDPGQAIYLADLSYIWMQLQEAPLAREAALKSIRLSGDNPKPYLVLGMIAQSEGHHEKAIEHLKTAMNLAPEYAFIHLELAQSYHSLSDTVKEGFHLGRFHRLDLAPLKAIENFQKTLNLIDERSPLALEIKQEINEITRDGV